MNITKHQWLASSKELKTSLLTQALTKLEEIDNGKSKEKNISSIKIEINKFVMNVIEWEKEYEI